MLKKLVLKMVKKYINIYKYKLSIFGRDDKKTSKKLYFHCGPSSKTISKSTKKKRRCQMLLEPIIIAIINLLNLQFVPDKAF